MKLNFLANKPNANGHIYSEDILKECFKAKDIMITSHTSLDKCPDLSDVIGFANLDKFNDEEITFSVRFIKDEWKEFESYFLTTQGIGEMDENKHILYYKLSHLFLTYDYFL